MSRRHDLHGRDLLILLGVARAGETGLVSLALQLARAARDVATTKTS